MLVELRIRDLAVVEHVTIEFGPGLNVLSGETGAGKSIIVDALTAALGARAGSDVVRSGAAAARVEARFALDPDTPARAWLAAQGLDDGELVVAREIGADGRSRSWINGQPSTIGMLRELGDLLVEVMGQHESQRLLRPQTHRDVLDTFGGAPVASLRAEVASRVARRSALRAERDALAMSERERARRIDLLRHQVQEIEAARLRPGEEEALHAQRVRLANAERLALAAAGAYAALYELEQGAAVDRIGQARTALRDATVLDPGLGPLVDRLETLAADLTEVAHQLADYREGIDNQPAELEAVEERLALIQALLRKHGAARSEDLISTGKLAAEELATLDASDARLAGTMAELEALDRELADLCTRLSRLRRDAAARLAIGVEHEMAHLDLRRARLEVAVTHEADDEGILIGDERVAVGPSGIDHVEFLLAANPGEQARPLTRVASGGELSRIMLALRHVLAASGGVPVVVFDEAEAGVGARTAGAVGQVLRTAARTRQVLCITHLAEIASLGDQHFWVAKDVVRGRTIVSVRSLTGRERVEEIARMLSGRVPTPIAREHASELLERARRKRAAGTVPRR